MENKIFSCIESRVKNQRSYYSRFKIGPFLKNQAHIYSNTLRRILLSNTNNIVISGINIVGIKHEYAILDGIKESTLDLLLNLKEIVFISDHSKSINKFYFCYLKSIGPKIVTASDLILPDSIQCSDFNQYIATLTENGELMMKMKLISKQNLFYYFDINSQYNSLLSSYFNSLLSSTIFSIELDSNFSCVNKVNYLLNSTDSLEHYGEFITLEVWTNASLSPYIILQNSIKEIIDLFLSTYNISTLNIYFKDPSKFFEKQLLNLSNKGFFLKQSFENYLQISEDRKELLINSFVNSNLNELDLSSSLKYRLITSGIFNVKDITRFTRKQFLLNFNISEKCLNKIEQNMLQHGLIFRES